ncbi:MAG: hypothetical protein EPN82_01255 [Bacteroidetes bacterium]|nr:MAG: hypothetical protein EPN82_01255 [Bacteroidota bacterium]
MERNFSLRVSTLSSLPFLFLGLFNVFSGNFVTLPDFFSGFFFFVPILLMFTLFVIGWVNDFPLWTIPSIGFCIIFSVLLMNVSIPMITGRTILGFWALLPFTMALLISIVIKPSIKPIKKLAERFMDDMSLIIFLLYGILPLIVLIVFDEMSDIKLIPILISISLIITFGAFFYLYSKKKVIRTISLILGIFFSLLIIIISKI